MKRKEFIEIHRKDPKGYCPCVVDVRGDVYECPQGHLDALLNLEGNQETLADIPKDMAPLFYMLAKTKAVAVDYENQIYSEELTQEQRYTLIALSEEGLISINLTDIHGNINL